MTAHVSALALDAFALGALDAAAAAEVAAHLAGCEACRSERDLAADARAEFLVVVLPRGLRARRRVRWWWLAMPVLAIAALLVVLLPRPPADPELGVKGAASWQVFAYRNGRTFAVRDGAQLAAGDRIRFAIATGAARYLLVASVDGRGAITIYHPYGGTRSAPVETALFELDGSIVLDAAPGPERIYALLSDEPLAADAVSAELRGVAAGGAIAIRGTPRLALPVRAQTSLVFEKVTP